MFENTPGDCERVDFVRCNLLRVCAHNEMNFMRGGIDLLEQALQINRSAGAGGGDYKFHGNLEFEFNR